MSEPRLSANRDCALLVEGFRCVMTSKFAALWPHGATNAMHANPSSANQQQPSHSQQTQQKPVGTLASTASAGDQLNMHDVPSSRASSSLARLPIPTAHEQVTRRLTAALRKMSQGMVISDDAVPELAIVIKPFSKAEKIGAVLLD